MVRRRVIPGRGGRSKRRRIKGLRAGSGDKRLALRLRGGRLGSTLLSGNGVGIEIDMMGCRIVTWPEAFGFGRHRWTADG